jgi:hypothetical protein
MADDTTFTRTRRSLHAVAELLLAGPQHAASGTIKLQPMLNGFGCTASPGASVKDSDLLLGTQFVHLDGRTIAQIGHEIGLEPRSLADVYSDGSGIEPDHLLSVDEESADLIADAFDLGDKAMRRLTPDQAPILWPEHFDLGITVDEVNYGVSPGDSHLATPYMYVGPWAPPPVDDFWNQPFGAARSLPPTVEAVVAFFDEARSRLGGQATT